MSEPRTPSAKDEDAYDRIAERVYSLTDEVHQWRRCVAYWVGDMADRATPEECRAEGVKRSVEAGLRMGQERFTSHPSPEMTAIRQTVIEEIIGELEARAPSIDAQQAATDLRQTYGLATSDALPNTGPRCEMHGAPKVGTGYECGCDQGRPPETIEGRQARCGHKKPKDVWVCTLERDHDGEHQAYGDPARPMIDSWPQEPTANPKPQFTADMSRAQLRAFVEAAPRDQLAAIIENRDELIAGYEMEEERRERMADGKDCAVHPCEHDLDAQFRAGRERGLQDAIQVCAAVEAAKNVAMESLDTQGDELGASDQASGAWGARRCAHAIGKLLTPHRKDEK